jgi:hypothetical protein
MKLFVGVSRILFWDVAYDRNSKEHVDESLLVLPQVRSTSRSGGHRHSIDDRLHERLREYDDVSGVIIRHTDRHAIGLTGIFAVGDSGEGTEDPADLITQVFFFRPDSLTCAHVGPADAAPFLVPIEAGDVQVR